ncbi:hypothetical protein [Schwartzia succinivorans]|nr:hypothetical protein [Schwartzia succinivorans]
MCDTIYRVHKNAMNGTVDTVESQASRRWWEAGTGSRIEYHPGAAG